MSALLLTAATAIVRAGLLVIILAATAFTIALLAEQVSLIRTAITKENQHHDHHA